jgi:DNA polymerase sigma
MTTPTEIRQRAKELVDQLPGESLAKALEFLESLCSEANQTSEITASRQEEEALLQIIQNRLPEDDQIRLAYLRQRNENEEITDTEHQELLNYVDQIEHQDAERAEALIQLAKLRDVHLKTLVNEFLPAHKPPDAF